MANQPEAGTYDAGVYQIETADAVQGGVGGIDNKPLLNLANRTGYLKSHIDAIEAGSFIPPTVAPLASPALTGSPTAPNVTSGDSSTKLANTNFVQNATGGIAAVAGLTNANVTLTAVQYGAAIVTLAGTLTGNINIIFPTQGDEWIVVNNTTGAFTITCKTAAGTGIAVTQGKSAILACDGTNIVRADTDIKPTLTTKQKFTASGTYTPTSSAVRRARIRMVGAGGGGSGSGTGTNGSGGTGGTTSINSVNALGGTGGSGTGNAGRPQAAGTGACTFRAPGFPGSQGTSAAAGLSGGLNANGGSGGGSLLGGGNGNDNAALANSGGGGGGASTNSAANAISGSGGGGGEYVELDIDNPTGTYAVVIGTGGAGGTAGTSGAAGQAGADGILLIEEFY